MRRARGRTASPGDRLLRHGPGARVRLGLGIAFGFVAAAIVVGQAWLTSVVVAGVFLGGGSMATVATPLLAIAVLAVVRAGFLLAADGLAQGASARIKSTLRADLTAQLFALGPAWTGRERSGELSSVLTDGLAAIDAYVTSFQPARALAGAVPLLVLVVVLVVDPPTTLVLLFTGPILVLLLGFIGGRARVITEQRFAEVRWLSAFFLDMLGGLATLKMFGRSREQVDTIRDDQPALRRHDDGGPADRVPDVARARVGRRGRGGPRRGRDQPAADGRLDRVRAARWRCSSSCPSSSCRCARWRRATTRGPPAGRSPSGRSRSSTSRARRAGRRPSRAPRPMRAPRSQPARGAGRRRPGPGRRRDPVRGRVVHLPGPNGAGPRPARPRASRAAGVVALVGATGAGKSTLASLLLRFIEPDAGAILVGDTPLAAIDPSAWRARLTWVPQRPHSNT